MLPIPKRIRKIIKKKMDVLEIIVIPQQFYFDITLNKILCQYSTLNVNEAVLALQFK